LHVLHVLIRKQLPAGVGFLVYPHDKWLTEDGQPVLTLPAKKTVQEHFEPFQHGSSLETYLEAILKDDLHLPVEAYALEQELEPVFVDLILPLRTSPTHYTMYPLDVWIDPRCHGQLENPETTKGRWMTCEQALSDPLLSPTASSSWINAMPNALPRKWAQTPTAGFCVAYQSMLPCTLWPVNG
jgi:hypothetical protein